MYRSITITASALLTFYGVARPAFAKITVGLIGQSILHQPGTQGTQTNGKNHFYYLVQWARSGAEPIEEAHHTISGAGLTEHMRNETTSRLIAQGRDYFALCEGTKYLWERGRTYEEAKSLSDRARAAGSIPVIYIPYAHANVGNPSDRGQPWFDPAKVMDEYMKVAARLDLAFVPVAHAMGEAVNKFGYGALYNDDKHLKSIGQFLTGCVHWATLTRARPEDIGYKGDGSGLDAGLMRNLVTICRDTITKYPPDARRLARRGEEPSLDAGGVPADAAGDAAGDAEAFDGSMVADPRPDAGAVVETGPIEAGPGTMARSDAGRPDLSTLTGDDDEGETGRPGRSRRGGCNLGGASNPDCLAVTLGLAGLALARWNSRFPFRADAPGRPTAGRDSHLDLVRRPHGCYPAASRREDRITDLLREDRITDLRHYGTQTLELPLVIRYPP